MRSVEADGLGVAEAILAANLWRIGRSGRTGRGRATVGFRCDGHQKANWDRIIARASVFFQYRDVDKTSYSKYTCLLIDAFVKGHFLDLTLEFLYNKGRDYPSLNSVIFLKVYFCQ